MLRATIDLDGSQRVMPEVPDYRIAVADLRGASAERQAEHLQTVRDALDHRVYEPATWPLFELRITRSASAPSCTSRSTS